MKRRRKRRQQERIQVSKDDIKEAIEAGLMVSMVSEGGFAESGGVNEN